MINRSLLIVRAKEPFVKWINALPNPANIRQDQVDKDNTVYLLPDLAYDDEQEDLLARFYDLIFQEQLSGWWTDESAWPPKRDLVTFKTWFDVEFHSAVLDLVEGPLEDDE
jgi:hypothetical protein